MSCKAAPLQAHNQGCRRDNSMVNDGKRAATMSDHPHDHRRLAEGALAGVCAAELVRSHRKKEGEGVSHGMGRIGHAVGAGALGAVAANEASRARNHHRSKNQRGPHSSEKYHSNYREHRDGHGSRSQGRSQTHSHAKTLAEVGVGIAVFAGVASLARGRSNTSYKREYS
ncbi:hypothetical protein VN97_g13005 [Penicillium thymicola]|uniref:Uncharacterized protein n=1 Tax=Penicillium thymicola TaxID=293382 RepID=A0AAI9T4I8_PENTH|nr:hypothetical protein VN97_g13005 [Penicillium thymicola]